jgi:hypothetical protein
MVMVDKTECNFSKEQIETILKEKKSGIKKFVIIPYWDNNLQSGCDGLFLINVIKLKGVYMEYKNDFYVYVPVLKIGNEIYINFDECNINNIPPRVQNELSNFRKKAVKLNFSEDEIKRMEYVYKHGTFVITDRDLRP